MDKRKCKTISFDLNDEMEHALMQYAESKGNFSRYMKRLINNDKNDMRGTKYIAQLPLQESDVDDTFSDYLIDDVGWSVEGSGDELDGFI